MLFFSKTSEAYSELCHKSKMEHFAKIVHGFSLTNIFAKCFILDVWKVSQYATEHHLHEYSNYAKRESSHRRWLLKKVFLTLSWRRPLSYRNQSIDLQSKSMDWFLHYGLRLERIKNLANFTKKHLCWSLFSINLIKRHSNTVVFLRDLRDF